MKNKLIILSAALSIFLVGCSGSGKNKSIDDTDYNPPGETGLSIKIDGLKDIERINITDNQKYTINMENTNKDLYVVFTNNNIDEETSGKISAKHNLIDAVKYKKHLKTKYNKDYKQLKAITNQVRSIDEEKDFHLDIDEEMNPVKTITAKVKLSREINTKFGPKVLTIWVENNSFACQEEGCVTQTNIEFYADKFLKDGLNNDIYDFETEIIGEEYNNGNYIELIADTNEINILFYPSETKNLLGFVNYKDFFKTDEIAGSNELLLFNLNSYALNLENQDPILTTIVHEFQHLISFSRRIIEKEVIEPTWINEMRSLMIEDILAEKVGTTGIRDISPEDGSAGPYGNSGSLLNFIDHKGSLYDWDYTLTAYGNASSLGVYLNREYNGAEILSNLIYSEKSGLESLEYETELTIKDIQKNWIYEEFASDIIGNKFNTGTWINTSYNNIDYKLGSINLFKLIQDFKYNSEMPTDVESGKTWIYQKGTDLEGNINIDVPEMNEDIDIYLMIK